MSPMRLWTFDSGSAVLVLALLSCSGEAVVDAADAGQTTSTTTSSTTSSSGSTSTTTNTTTGACSSFTEFCDCWAVNGCHPVGAGCLCYCDYECPGEDPCDCGCGGGEYVGCAAVSCPQLEFPEGSQVGFGDDGCPYLIQ